MSCAHRILLTGFDPAKSRAVTAVPLRMPIPGDRRRSMARRCRMYCFCPPGSRRIRSLRDRARNATNSRHGRRIPLARDGPGAARQVDDASRWRARSVADRTRGFAAAIDLPNDGTIRADGCLWARGNTALDPRTRHRQLATWNHGQSLDRADSTPKVPVRLYSGQLDVDVYPDESIHQAARWRDRHVDVEHIDLGPVDHEGGVVEAVLSTREWFDALAEYGWLVDVGPHGSVTSSRPIGVRQTTPPGSLSIRSDQGFLWWGECNPWPTPPEWPVLLFAAT